MEQLTRPMQVVAVKMTCVEALVVKVLHEFGSHEAGGQAELVTCVCVFGGRGGVAAWNKEMGWMVVVWRMQLGVPNALVRYLKGL